MTTTYTYELIDGGFIVKGSNGLTLNQPGDPDKPADNGVLQPYADEDREAAAQAVVAFLKAADASAGSMRAPGF